MTRRHELIYALNAGGVDPDAVARVDLEKLRLAGEHPVANVLPRVLGPMTLSPGLEHRVTLSGVTRPVPFAETNLLLMSSSLVTVCDSDGTPLTITSSASTIANGDFSAALSGAYATGWKDDSASGTGAAATAATGSYLELRPVKNYSAAVQQQIAIAGGDQANRHTVRVEVTRGPVLLRMGTSQDGADLLSETELKTGTHKLSVTPNASSLWIKIRAEGQARRRVASCRFEHTVLGGSGNLTIASPWDESRLPYLSWDRSIDVLFIADGTARQRRIERRGTHSWSLVEYQTRNGPFRTPVSADISLTPNAVSGNITLTASAAYFTTAHVGCLFELTHNNQYVEEILDGAGQTTDAITVTGIFDSTGAPSDRLFAYDATFAGGTTATVELQRSVDADGLVWSTVLTLTATGSSASYQDRQSNLLARYRWRCSAYTSGSVTVSLNYPGGSQTGQVRVTEFSSSTSVSAEVVEPLGQVIATKAWREPAWSNTLGWPRVLRFADTRLHWFFNGYDYASRVDDFDNFEDAEEGDSASFTRSVRDDIYWALDLQHLVAGSKLGAVSIRASQLDEPLTSAQFTVRPAGTKGAALVPAVQVDTTAIYPHRSLRKLYELVQEGVMYRPEDMTRLVPSALSGRVKAMAVQAQPDTRIYVVTHDGEVVVITYERDDKVKAFTTRTASGATFEDVAVLPADDQDDVFLVANRSGVRSLVRLAPEREQSSVSTCALLDFHKVLTGSVSQITGATHLANETVQVWADGRRRSDVVLNGSGVGSLGATYARVVYGKSYTATFKTVKLAHAAQLGTALGQTKMVRGAGLVLRNSCLDGIRVGRDAATTEPLPTIVNGVARTTNQLFTHYDADIFPINSDWDADARFYLSIDSAEGPCTVQGIVLDIETRDGAGDRDD